MLKLASDRKSDQLRTMIKNLEIPDDRAWVLANFGAPGSETADRYEKYLASSEDTLKDQMVEFSRQDGYFSVKKQDVKKVYPDIVKSPEVLLASWERRSDYEEMPIGYFMLIDGKFRWDSTRQWVIVD